MKFLLNKRKPGAYTSQPLDYGRLHWNCELRFNQLRDKSKLVTRLYETFYLLRSAGTKTFGIATQVGESASPIALKVNQLNVDMKNNYRDSFGDNWKGCHLC